MRTTANAPSVAVSPHIEIVTESRRFEALKPEWDALWLRSGNAGVFQSFDCCLNVWQSISEPAGRKLFSLVGWDNGRMIAAWPLTTYRKLAWKYVRPLDASGAEFADILMDETIDQRCWIRGAWQLVSTKARSDVIVLPYLRKGTEIDNVLSRCTQKTSFDRDVAVYVRLTAEKDWESYCNSLSKGHRRRRVRERRQLAELGTVKFEIIDGSDLRTPELISWMLFHKKIWADRTNKKGHWLYSAHYHKFLTRLLVCSGANPKALMMVLTLHGIPIATMVLVVGKETVEALIGAFDLRYQKYSPGIRLDEHCMQWAMERKLNFDFGNGGERSKTFWSRNEVIETATYHIAASWWGIAALRLREHRKGWQSFQRTLNGTSALNNDSAELSSQSSQH